MLNIQLSDVKVFYDQKGQAQEVLISYATFQQFKLLLEQMQQTSSEQAYFWSEQWQARIQAGEADIQAGRSVRVKAHNIEDALEWLDE